MCDGTTKSVTSMEISLVAVYFDSTHLENWIEH